MRVYYASSVAVKLSAEVISASFKTNSFLQVAEQFTQKKITKCLFWQVKSK